MKLILIVDDSMSALMAMERSLRRLGYESVSADNGLCAIELIKTRQPDLILMDVLMPHMHGLECCEAIMSDPKTKHIPIVMVTSMSDPQTEIMALQAGARDFIKKPVNVEILKLRIENLLVKS